MGTDSLGKPWPQSRIHEVLQFYVLTITAEKHRFAYLLQQANKAVKSTMNCHKCKYIFTYEKFKALYVVSCAWHRIWLYPQWKQARMETISDTSVILSLQLLCLLRSSAMAALHGHRLLQQNTWAPTQAGLLPPHAQPPHRSLFVLFFFATGLQSKEGTCLLFTETPGWISARMAANFLGWQAPAEHHSHPTFAMGQTKAGDAPCTQWNAHPAPFSGTTGKQTVSHPVHSYPQCCCLGPRQKQTYTPESSRSCCNEPTRQFTPHWRCPSPSYLRLHRPLARADDRFLWWQG